MNLTWKRRYPFGKQPARPDLLQALFGRVVIPRTVKVEVVDRGKEEGKADAFLVEGEIRNGWIVVEDSVDEGVEDIADSAGIESGEAEAIMLARSKQCLVLLDDLAARRFAAGLGLDAIEKLARVMWLSVGVYEDVHKVVEGLRLRDNILSSSSRRPSSISSMDFG